MKENLPPVGFVERLFKSLPAAGEREAYITSVLIPKMDERRREGRSLTREEIEEKLASLDPLKPGEEHEVAKALRDSGNKLMTADLALEIADLVYLWLQPNYSMGESESVFTELILGDWDLACAFCIVKYETRMACGDAEDYKRIETLVMAKFLKKLSNSSQKYRWLDS